MNRIAAASAQKAAAMLQIGTRKVKNGIARSHILTYFLLICLSFLFLYPFLFLLITSVKSPADLQDITVNWVPTTLYFKNYAVAYEYLYYFKFLKNSLVVTTLSVLGNLISSSMIAYGFSRYHFRGRNLLFMLVILTVIIPVQTIIIPMSIQYSNLGWANTLLPLIVPNFFGFGLRGGLYIFIFRQFYIGLPLELEEAAQIDGCGAARTYIRIILPNAKPAIVVNLILSMVWHWNDYYEPIFYITSSDKRLLPQLLTSIVHNINNSAGAAEIANQEVVFTLGVLMAGAVLVLMPIVLVFFLLQKQFMEGIERTGLVG